MSLTAPPRNVGSTAELAHFVRNLRFEDLPDHVIRAAVVAIRDALGVGLYAGHLEWVRAVRSYVEATNAPGRSTVWATGLGTAPAFAALANGTAVHGIEMDDRSSALDIHNGAATVPAAIAAAEHHRANGRQLILGVVAGYEVAYRLARATQGCIAPRFHGNSIRNTFGATTAAALIAGLDEQAFLYALGLAGSLTTGAKSAHGYFVKRLQGGGWPAHNGITAAALAAAGLTASPAIFEAPDGVCASFSTSREPDYASLTAGLGDTFEILGWETKPYAAWGGSHSSLDAVRQLQVDHAITGSDVQSVDLGVSNKILPDSNKPWPTTVMKAQRHLQFLVATQFYRDLRNPDSWTDDILTDESIRRLASRVSVRLDEEIEINYRTHHDHGGVKMRVRTVDGRSFDIKVRHATGTFQNPMSDSQLRGKFRLLAGKALHDDRVKRVERYLDALPGIETVGLADAIGA